MRIYTRKGDRGETAMLGGGRVPKSDPRIRAVTPFVLRGSPGAFTLFSFLDAGGKPTRQFDAFQKAMEK